MAEHSTRAKPIEAFVCGHPIAHSRSPMIHGYWLNTYDVNGSYRAIDIAPSDFTDFMGNLPKSGLAGGNVTIPHKETAFRLVAVRDEAAELTGAVNMLWLENGELRGGNTDVHGFAANLDQHAPAWQESSRAVVVGAGGAARAVLLALRRAGVGEIRVVNRSRQRAIELKDRFGGKISAFGLEALPEILGDADLLVNTTSLGMLGNTDLPADPRHLPAHAIVADLVYVPLRTPLLFAADQCGLKTVDGLGMLLHQAAPAFARWFGVVPIVSAELRDLVVADILAKT